MEGIVKLSISHFLLIYLLLIYSTFNYEKIKSYSNKASSSC